MNEYENDAGLFKAGDKVVCVSPAFPAEYRESFSALPELDVVYCVRGVVHEDDTIVDYCDDWGVYLVGIFGPAMMDGTEFGFDAGRFRREEEVRENNRRRHAAMAPVLLASDFKPKGKRSVKGGRAS